MDAHRGHTFVHRYNAPGVNRPFHGYHPYAQRVNVLTTTITTAEGHVAPTFGPSMGVLQPPILNTQPQLSVSHTFHAGLPFSQPNNQWNQPLVRPFLNSTHNFCESKSYGPHPTFSASFETSISPGSAVRIQWAIPIQTESPSAGRPLFDNASAPVYAHPSMMGPTRPMFQPPGAYRPPPPPLLPPFLRNVPQPLCAPNQAIQPRNNGPTIMPAEAQREVRQEPLKLTWIDETSLYLGKEGGEEKMEEGKEERKELVKEEKSVEENKRYENEEERGDEESAKIDAIKSEDVKKEEMDEYDGEYEK